ncbi:MAG: VTT domain-containing protein [Prevotella sp.]|nr:DedA family protein [Prevotella sp.]MCI5571062.1 VTT domain-containing protein [Prevotella sp.]MCI6370808.1 VTT domain-containing protein [Prevotella sp.]MCI6404401.1 VTT domain-containing protein [Prevotella sp.]MCI6448838.1 VTT domain-containing protein [Prevotella sp.]
MLDLLVDYGPIGMLIASFIAGSVFPFSSEAVMLAMLAAGVDPWELVITASIGNVAGSMFNYGVGRLGRLDWIEKYLHVKKESLDRAQRFMGGHGAWMGFFAFLPILGSAISILLGLMRANIIITLISITLGKVMRYLIIAWPFM